ncbi:uncharacterized protein LOC125015775 isoform X1 [Mugil cephalus]|uniref:uncharacterized protein LOC125015775 isoform X1 n=2 Tax=Mugil cephalus TaxID=48193 RepID=UPI001FB6CB19|nr:uncharacterized protein LOC125015775 isoform X1 [Mugil cephalus]
MKLDVKIEFLKFFSAVTNTIFLVLGLSVFGCGVWIEFGHGTFMNIFSSAELQTVAVGLLVIGGVVVTISIVGCVGASVENRFMLLVYCSFLFMLILGQLFIMLLLFFNRDSIEDSLNDAVDKIIIDYGGSNFSKSEVDLVDSLQRNRECCGRNGPHDWLKNKHLETLNLTHGEPEVLPCSCFNSSKVSTYLWCSEVPNITEPEIGLENGTFDQGCQHELSIWLEENSVTIVGMVVSLILLQMVQFAFAASLYRLFGTKASLKETSRLIDNQPDHEPDIATETDQNHHHGNQGQYHYQDQDQNHYQDQDQGQYQGQNHYQDQDQGHYQDQDQGQYQGQNHYQDQGQYQGQNQNHYRDQYQGQDQGQYQGQDQYPGQNQNHYQDQEQGQYQGQNHYQDQDQGQYQGQNHYQDQDQDQDQDQNQNQNHYRDQYQGQDQGQYQGQDQYQGQNQNHYQDQAQGQYQGQNHYQGHGQGQYQGHNQNHYRDQYQGQYQGQNPYQDEHEDEDQDQGQNQYHYQGQYQGQNQYQGQYQGQYQYQNPVFQ